jgi:hypothetical protein
MTSKTKKAYIAAMPGWKRDVGRRLDALIARTIPSLGRAVKSANPRRSRPSNRRGTMEMSKAEGG